MIWTLILFAGFTTYQDFNISHDTNILFVFSVFVAVLIANPYISARKLYKSTPDIAEERIWKIDETGVEIKNKSSLMWVGWNSITKFSEDNKLFFIWFNDAQNIHFPKNIVSEKEFYEIKELMFTNGKKGL